MLDIKKLNSLNSDSQMWISLCFSNLGHSYSCSERNMSLLIQHTIKYISSSFTARLCVFACNKILFLLLVCSIKLISVKTLRWIAPADMVWSQRSHCRGCSWSSKTSKSMMRETLKTGWNALEPWGEAVLSLLHKPEQEQEQTSCSCSKK